MKLNKEQITLLVVAAGLGWLAYDALTAAPVKAPAKSGRILVQESPDAPLGALADAMLAAEETTWSAEAKNIYRAPREESPLPPVALPTPPRSTLPVAMPQPMPGLDPFSRLAWIQPIDVATGVSLPPRQTEDEAAAADEEPVEEEGAQGTETKPTTGEKPAEGAVGNLTEGTRARIDRLNKTAEQRALEERQKRESALKEAERLDTLDKIKWQNGDVWYGEITNDAELPPGTKGYDKYSLKLKIDEIRNSSDLAPDAKAKALGDRELEVRFRRDMNGKLTGRQTLSPVQIAALEFSRNPINDFQLKRRSLAKENGDAHLELARSLVAAGEFGLAKNHLTWMSENGHAQRDLFVTLYDASQGAYDHDTALRALTDGLKKFPSDSELVAALGDLYARFALDNVAQATFRRALDSGVKNARINARYGKFKVSRGLRSRGDAAQAVDALTKAISARLENTAERNQAHCDLAAAQVATGNLAEAQRLYNDVLSLDVTHSNAIVGLSAVEILSKKFADAKNRLEALAVMDAQNGRALYNLGCANIGLGKWAEARDAFYDAKSADPMLGAAAEAALGYLYERLGDKGEAQRRYEAAFEADQRDPDILLTLARGRMLNGGYDEAKKTYLRALGTLPDQFDALAGLAECEYELGRYADSLRYTDAALALAPKSAFLFIRKAQTLVRLGRLPDAKKALEDAKALQPNDEVEVNFAWYFYNEGNFQEAPRRFQTILAGLDRKNTKPIAEYVRRWSPTIDDNLSKSVWSDHFNRALAGAEVGYGWTIYAPGSGLRPGLAKNQVVFSGQQKQSDVPSTIYQEIQGQEFVVFEVTMLARPKDDCSAAIGLFRFQKRAGREAQQSPYVGKDTASPAADALIFGKSPEGFLAYRTIRNFEMDRWQVVAGERWPEAKNGEPEPCSIAIEIDDPKKSTFNLKVNDRTVVKELEIKGLVRAGPGLQLWVLTQAEIDKKVDVRVDDARIVKRKGGK